MGGGSYKVAYNRYLFSWSSKITLRLSMNIQTSLNRRTNNNRSKYTTSTSQGTHVLEMAI